MATRNNDETNGYTFQWKIENISHCWLKPFERIESPIFIADTLESTKWSLWLYPLGQTNEKENVSFFLHREDCSGPGVIEINYQLAFLNNDGSFLKEFTIRRRGFERKREWGFREFINRERVFFTEREAFLPEDTLTLQCTLWKKDETCAKPKHSHARTVFTVNRRSFVWKIDAFSTLKPGLKNRLRDGFIDFDLVLNEELGFEKKIIININSFDQRMKYFSFKTSIIDWEGKKENCRINKCFASDLKEGALSPMLLFPDKLMEHSRQYLPNDSLSLDCEYVYSTETNSYEIFGCGIIYPNSIEEVTESKKKHYVAKEKSHITSALIDDLKSMYNDSICNDTELRTSTKTFPAHKGILSARSPVFRRMFTNDMKEKNCGHVDISDLEDDTVHRMLTYVYTDSLEDLQLDSAFKLYAAADKYEILSLKTRCSSFMKENLCPTKACEVLFLADQHQDVDLKCFVQDYILEHDKEVFGSQEWKDFMDTNLKLAANIMYLKVYPE
ncbi:TD and POZ domain-containing protein 5 [Araneus ventricosus]|uniref:TD and POZ domain-containing protein 5 n=1 Tax=Araneus ventricosus TaxID=182803 RepID=A0A4Y2X7C0_ARAVE|nr:TD and POZ domain-containing protein 5 [Araneus ventricosus]